MWYINTKKKNFFNEEILLSHKKEQLWVSSSEMDEPRACYTEWTKSKREKKSYINAYTWDLETWYWWNYLCGTKRDTDIESRPAGTAREGEAGASGEARCNVRGPKCESGQGGRQWAPAGGLGAHSLARSASLEGRDAAEGV